MCEARVQRMRARVQRCIEALRTAHKEENTWEYGYVVAGLHALEAFMLSKARNAFNPRIGSR
jgi:hypothetical protein